MASARRTTTQRRTLLGIVAAVGVAGAMLLAPAAPAQATGNQRTFTAALSPSEIEAQAATDMTLTVKNTSAVVSYLDRVRVTVPTGLAVVAGAVTAPRGGWSQQQSGDTVTAKTTKPLSSGLRRGESLSMALSVTATDCVPATASWMVRADGILFVFRLVGEQPRTTVTDAACAGGGGGESEVVVEELEPGVPATLTVRDATAILGNGASGQVVLSSVPCDEDEGLMDPCELGDRVITLEGDFAECVDEACDVSSKLYGTGLPDTEYPLPPITLLIRCSTDVCDEDQVVFVSVLNENYTVPDTAPACSEDGQTTGVLATEGALSRGFCVDRYAIGEPSDGILTLPVLFFEDPKFIVGR